MTMTEKFPIQSSEIAMRIILGMECFVCGEPFIDDNERNQIVKDRWVHPACEDEYKRLNVKFKWSERDNKQKLKEWLE